ncbi:MAG: hypothetical protein IKV86_08140 [Clostridia bacterium]|nr:hypothetical protein [Clostridia bacterium]
MKAKQIVTFNEHLKSEFEIFPAIYGNRYEKYTVGNKITSDFMGFGVAITGSSCYNLMLMEKSERRKLLESIYSKEGANLTIARLTVAPCDYAPEIYSYDDVPFDTELKHFSIERDEKYVIPIIKEILEINPDIYIYASPWSPPGWMKTGGNMLGGYMLEEYVECFANYYLKFIKAYAEHGIKISAITPQNEPDNHQEGLMPACIWHPAIEAKFVKVMKKLLKENNLDIEIWIYDFNFSGANRPLWQLDNNIENIKENCEGVAFHYYVGNIEETKVIKEKHPEMKLHFTEGGPRLTDHYDNDWCKWGIMITKAMQCGYSSFTGWNLMLNELGGPQIGPFPCGGLVMLDSRTKELSYSGQLKVFEHIAPYITPKSVIYALDRADSLTAVNTISSYPYHTHLCQGFVIDNDGKKVIIVVNPDEKRSQAEFFVDGKWWFAELPGESISTIIFE